VATRIGKAEKEQSNGTMKFLPFMSTFFLEKMCGLIRTNVWTDTSFMEDHWTAIENNMFEHSGSEVISGSEWIGGSR
jgi:hypothetical protein